MAIEVLTEYPLNVSVEEYLVRERQAEYKSEYVYGEIRAMAGASRAHITIVTDLTVLIGTQLRGKRCQVFSSDLKVAADPDGFYVYPDLTVICDKPDVLDESQGIVVNPTVIFEVLSPSTEIYDRGQKSDGYRQIESLQELIFISQTEPRVEQFTRKKDGQWVSTLTQGLVGVVTLDSIGCTLLLSEVYERVKF